MLGADLATLRKNPVTFGADLITLAKNPITPGSDLVTFGHPPGTFGTEVVTFGHCLVGLGSATRPSPLTPIAFLRLPPPSCAARGALLYMRLPCAGVRSEVAGRLSEPPAAPSR
jgi:hypothetical protein